MARLLGARRMLADVRPLRESAEYRRLWLAGALSGMGTRMTGVAVPVQVYTLTHSSLAVGLLGVPLAVPLIGVGLLGGFLIDRVDRRTLVLITTALLAAVSLALAAQAFVNLRQVWLLYALIAIQSSVTAIDQPARRTFLPRLLPPERIRAANALYFLSFHVSTVVGPLVAGALIAYARFQTIYLIDAASFIIALYAIFRLRPMRPEGGQAVPGIQAVLGGLRFVRHHPVLSILLLADLNATVFGMPLALFPAIAVTRFGGLQNVGFLYAGPAIGGFVAAAFSGPLEHVRRQGLVVLIAIGVWGAAIAGFGFSRVLWLAILMLAIAGAADTVNGVFRTTILLVSTPDALQGRVSGVGFVVGAGGPRLGDIEAGAVATLTSPVISAVSGGLACVAGVLLIGLLAPSLARYRPEPATRVP